MKNLLYLLTVSMMLVVTSCEEFDDLSDRIEDLEGRITRLELLCDNLNDNISLLASIVDIIQKNDFVKNVVPIEENGEVVGYEITFTQSGSVKIYHKSLKTRHISVCFNTLQRVMHRILRTSALMERKVNKIF